MEWMQHLYTQASIALRSLRDREEGQGLVEYALILFLVAIGAIVFLTAVGVDVQGSLDEVADTITSPAPD